MRKKINLWMMILILCVTLIIGTVVGVMIWLFNSSANDNEFASMNWNSCLLYKNHKASQVNLSRPNNSQELIYQFNKFGILQNQGINPSSLTNNDYSFINTCENEMLYTASNDSINQFDSYANKNSLVSINDIIKALTNNSFYKYHLQDLINQAPVLEQSELQNELIYFYNLLYNIYGSNLLSHLIYNIELAPTSDNVVAYNKLGIFNNNVLQCQVFGQDSVNTSTINSNYNVGWWSTNNIIGVIVHETGHALENYAWIIPSNRNQFNINANQETKTCSEFNSSGTTNVQVYNLLPSDYLVRYLGEKAGVSNNFPLEQQLAAWSFIQSGYGRKGPLEVGGNRELFAEAFAQWILTPANKRGLNWQALDQFFLQDFIKQYNLIN